MADTFQPGDVVRLKSGGPLMTVAKPDEGSEYCTLEWFSGDSLLVEYLLFCQLVKVDPCTDVATGKGTAWCSAEQWRKNYPTAEQIEAAKDVLSRDVATTVVVADTPGDALGSPVFVPKWPSDGSGHAT